MKVYACKNPEVVNEFGRVEYQTSKDVISGVFYNARATIRTVPDRFKTYTPWVTSANVTGNQTVYAELDLSGLEGPLAWLRNSTRTAQDAIDGLLAGMMELSVVAYKDTRNLAREFSVELGAARAEYREDIQLAVNETMAVAGKVETLTAALGGNTASINIAWAAIAAPAGYAARYGITAAVNDGQYRSASFLMDVPSNPASPTRIIMKAGQVVMVSDDDATIKRPFVFQSGVLYLDEVRVNQLSALSAVLGNVDISSAYIGTLTVGTSNIDPGAVSVAVSAASGTLVVNHGAGPLNVLIIWKTRGTMSTTVNPPGLATATMTLSESGNVIDTMHSSSVQSGATAYVTSSVNFAPPAGRTQTTFTIGSGSGPSGSLQSGSLVSQITALVFKR